MTFQESIERLGIEDYGHRIFESSSTGELMHLQDYMVLAETIKPENLPQFRSLFLEAVKFAEANWLRPESCFQHMPRLMSDLIKANQPSCST
jgi:hypothetical protein